MNKKEFEIRLGSKCNIDCKFCHIPQLKPQNLKTKQIINKIFFTINHSNATNITITGGEPTLFKELKKIIKLIKKMNPNHSVCLQTNGLLLSNNIIIKELVQAGLDEILLSFHSHKKKDYNKITNSKNQYGKIIKAIKNINKYDVKLDHSIVICKTNYKYLDKTINFLNSRVKEIRYILIANIFEKINYKKKKDYHIKLKKLKGPLKKVFKFAQIKDIKIVTCGIPLCYVNGNYSTYMLGQYNKDRFFKKNKKCSICKLNNYCRGIIGDYASLYGTNEISPIKDINKKEFEILKKKIKNHKEKIYINNSNDQIN